MKFQIRQSESLSNSDCCNVICGRIDHPFLSTNSQLSAIKDNCDEFRTVLPFTCGFAVVKMFGDRRLAKPKSSFFHKMVYLCALQHISTF